MSAPASQEEPGEGEKDPDFTLCRSLWLACRSLEARALTLASSDRLHLSRLRHWRAAHDSVRALQQLVSLRAQPSHLQLKSASELSPNVSFTLQVPLPLYRTRRGARRFD